MMKWLILLLVLLTPALGAAEEWQAELQTVLDALDMTALEKAAHESGWLEGGAAEMLGKLARGEVVLTAAEVWNRLLSQAAGIFKSSVFRITRLMAPALLASAAEWLPDSRHAASRAARYAGMVLTMAFLVSDLKEHTALALETVTRMSDWMQALFPVMVTLMASVGAAASSAFYQPAVMAAAGSMTTLIQQVTLPLAAGVAVLTMVSGLSDGLRVTRMCRLFRQMANWTLGLGFTVFIGVMTVQGVSVAAVDGVSIRTAKFALNRFVPIVGGMFSDTVDTLVGCSLVVEHAVGLLGVVLLMSALLVPLVRTVLTLFLYRAAAALLEPVSDGPLCRTIGNYAEVFSLLFAIQLSVGAMFLLLTAQMITVADLTVMLR